MRRAIRPAICRTATRSPGRSPDSIPMSTFSLHWADSVLRALKNRPAHGESKQSCLPRRVLHVHVEYRKEDRDATACAAVEFRLGGFLDAIHQAMRGRNHASGAVGTRGVRSREEVEGERENRIHPPATASAKTANDDFSHRAKSPPASKSSSQPARVQSRVVLPRRLWNLFMCRRSFDLWDDCSSPPDVCFRP